MIVDWGVLLLAVLAWWLPLLCGREVWLPSWSSLLDFVLLLNTRDRRRILAGGEVVPDVDPAQS